MWRAKNCVMRAPRDRYNTPMVFRILKYVLLAIIIVIIALWFWTNGWSGIVSFVRTIPNPVDILLGRSSDSYVVQLPWQIPIPQGPDISGYADIELPDDPGARLDEIEAEYERIKRSAEDLQAFGEPSQYRGTILLSAGNAAEDGTAEFVEIRAASNARPTTISGWSLQSVLTGARATIPSGAGVFIQGALNRVDAITLESGMRAIVTSGHSPVGVSLRESMCTGYLSQNQKFEPGLANTCPIPRETTPLNAVNLKQYGDTCLDFIQRMPQCHYPTSLPSELSYACRLYLANTYSYNGCVATLKNDRRFLQDTWRIYLGSPAELWRNSHDVIRLLDAEGRTVDSVTY